MMELQKVKIYLVKRSNYKGGRNQVCMNISVIMLQNRVEQCLQSSERKKILSENFIPSQVVFQVKGQHILQCAELRKQHSDSFRKNYFVKNFEMKKEQRKGKDVVKSFKIKKKKGRQVGKKDWG